MRVLVIGSGGREHALVAALGRSARLQELHCAPGNPGIAELARCHPVPVADREGLVHLATDLHADLVVVGPEAPLVDGLADALRHSGIPTFGPGRDAARLEGSKAFAKEVMAAAGVPTARAIVAATADEVRDGIAELGSRVVVKADGLAAGKGVVVCDDPARAEAAAGAMLAGAHGEAGHRVVLEERLEGEEVSLLAICDREVAVPLAPARDYKRVGDGDTGPNTGGMGAHSPVPGVDTLRVAALVETVHRPVLRELERRGVHFTGCLYAGLMLTEQGPRVLEFNVRFGDPEAQAILPRVRGDLLVRLHDAATGQLTPAVLDVADDAAVAIVLAAPGYPQAPELGGAIDGVADALATGRDGSVAVFHGGTALQEGRLVTAGGRVLAVSALGADLAAARARAYAASDRIRFPGLHRRGDIGAA